MLTLLLATLVASLAPSHARAQTGSVQPATANVPFGSQPVGSASSTIAVSFTISPETTIGSVSVLTTGIANKDFTDAGSSTCTAQTYSATTACVVNVKFNPIAPGVRRGAVVIADGSGNALATVPLYGNGTGPQTAYSPTTPKIIASSLSSPYGLAVDAAGDVFIADVDSGQVLKVTPAGIRTVAAAGMLKPTGLAIDGAGNLFVADPLAHAVWEITPSGVQTEPMTGLNNPFGLSFDGAGDMFFIDASLDHITKITPEGVQTPLGSGFNFPAGVAIDNAGNVFVADVGNGEVHKITSAGVMTTFVSGLDLPANIALDAAGNLYVTEFGNGQVIQITPAGVQTTFVSTAVNPFGMVMDGSGNLYYADSATGIVAKLSRELLPATTFAATLVGSTSSNSPKIIGLENIGNASLSFSAITYPADFPENGSALDDCSTSTPLSIGTSCTFTIDFSPVTPLTGKNTLALLSENVNVTSNTLNATSTTQRVPVSGYELSASASVPLTVTLIPAARMYGSPNPRFEYAIAGLLTGDSVIVTPQTTATLTSPVGSYPVTATVTGPATAHYTITVKNSTLQVYKSVIYISASNVAVTYGQTPPQPTAYTLYGFVNGDSAAVVTGAPVLTTTVTSSTPVGVYRIGVQVGTLTATNYTFDTGYSGEGNVAVYKAPLRITANNATMTQGSSVPALTYTLSGFVNGDSASVVTGTASLSTSVTSATKSGRYYINPSQGTLAAQNYDFSYYTSGALTVTH